MSRLLLQALFVVAAFSFGTYLVQADDADVSASPTEATVPADAEKGAEATKETASPKPAENKDAAESSGDKKATGDSASDPTSTQTESTPESKPVDASTEDAKPTEPKPTEPKPTEPKPTAAEDSTTKNGSADTETTATNEKLEPWQELHQQWLVVDKRLRETELKYYHTTDKAEQFELRGTFEKMIETEAIPLLAKLRAEVMKAYSAKPNEVQLVRLLIGFMVNHARMLEVADAKEIVELLIDNKCDEKYVMVASRTPGLSRASLDILEQMEKRYRDALSANDSNTDSDATPSSGDSSSPTNENPGGTTGASTEAEKEEPAPSKTEPE